MVALTILKDGKPAMDLGLYLGVPAHAVFVSTDDLGYVHAHAMAADSPKGGHASQGSHDKPKAAIPAKLMLQATPPRAGRYAQWIQFKGDGQLRTVQFVVNVPAAPLLPTIHVDSLGRCAKRWQCSIGLGSRGHR
ncbi:MAG: hypothetical protein ACOH2K_04215 [Burkholderiaceae bacterium]